MVGRTSLAQRAKLLALIATATLVVGGCTSTYAPELLMPPDELHDVQSKTVGDVSVSVAILRDEQARQHFGVDLARYDVQALWISVRNASHRRLWFIRNVLDRDYYSADEVGLMAEGDVSRDGRDVLHQHLRDESMRALILPRTVTEGFMYLPRAQGGRYVDIRLQGDAYAEGAPAADPGSNKGVAEGPPPRELRFDFAVPLPDGNFDFERLDPDKTYAARELPDLALEQLRQTLEDLPCCVTNAEGDAEGDPLNVVIVGEASEVLNSLSRCGWSFTHRINLGTIRKEIGAAIAGSSYTVAPVSNLYLFGRSQDLALQRARNTITRRNHMRLWLAPFRFESREVWVGQVSRDIGIKLTPKTPTLTTHIIDPEVDSTREYLLHSLLAEGFVDRFGFVKGAAAALPSEPRHNLTDDPYFSDGMRLVVILAGTPVTADQVGSLRWEQSAPPIAEGQSGAARRNVRPLDADGEDLEQ